MTLTNDTVAVAVAVTHPETTSGHPPVRVNAQMIAGAPPGTRTPNPRIKRRSRMPRQRTGCLVARSGRVGCCRSWGTRWAVPLAVQPCIVDLLIRSLGGVVRIGSLQASVTGSTPASIRARAGRSGAVAVNGCCQPSSAGCPMTLRPFGGPGLSR
jgi:hypothetical protein